MRIIIIEETEDEWKKCNWVWYKRNGLSGFERSVVIPWRTSRIPASSRSRSNHILTTTAFCTVLHHILLSRLLFRR